MTASGVTAQGEEVSRIHAKTDIVSVDTPSPSCTDDTNVRQAIHSNLKLFKPGPTWIWQLDATACIEQVDPTNVDVRLRPGTMWTNGPDNDFPCSSGRSMLREWHLNDRVVRVRHFIDPQMRPDGYNLARTSRRRTPEAERWRAP